MSILNVHAAAVLLLALFPAIQADVLRLKSGENLQGLLVSVTSGKLQFAGVRGGAKTYAVGDVDSVEFAPLPPPPPPPAAASGSSAGALVIPAGTEITVRMIDSIKGSATSAGQRYNATVDDPVMVGNEVALGIPPKRKTGPARASPTR